MKRGSDNRYTGTFSDDDIRLRAADDDQTAVTT
jgi:hypothetical protein